MVNEISNATGRECVPCADELSSLIGAPRRPAPLGEGKCNPKKLSSISGCVQRLRRRLDCPVSNESHVYSGKMQVFLDNEIVLLAVAQGLVSGSGGRRKWHHSAGE